MVGMDGAIRFSAYSGGPGHCLKPSRISTQGNLSETYQCSVGLTTAALSMVPIVIHTVSGSVSNTNVNGLPQSPQCVRTAFAEDR